MKYELLSEDNGIKIFARIDDDGLCRLTCSEDDSNYLAWLENPQGQQSTPMVTDEADSL